ncbi:hypothetical protein HBE96_01515 [Clostridium sp. P21]|uniref:Lipoprotein n=1 Tax=Clostridium muellerianum TaxID=2716538 RepID=A0A7Y0HM92_9CLOT|nr:hypothetical protein [Clostridium muellerianum]NMM61397.1 hypothetical protein [Clostridium muellerianum]
MKFWFKTVILITTFLIGLTFTSCSAKKDTKVEVDNIPKYSEVTVLENSNGSFNAFRVQDKTLNSIGTADNIREMSYNIKSSVYAQSINVLNGENSNKNVIDINASGKRTQLKDFYSAIDLKLSDSGSKLAFRTFKSNSLESAEGMKVYDIKNNKYLKLKSEVLISGNLYQWIDENRIIYYGSIEGQKNSQKIYVYDFNKDKEEVYLNDINGTCIYFIAMKNGILILSRQRDTQQLYYYNIEDKISKNISNNISEIYKSITKYKDGEVFFLGSEEGQTNALYMFSNADFTLKRVTYDFPKNIDISSGLAVDSQENVYFCGMENAEENNKKDVFMYDRKEGSLNLISTEEGNYSVYSETK